ncbi:MAG: SirA-like protein [Burkholderiales bacterium RIFCSPLOWO2_12_FULL_61_40]|nr:MAG: SirA-like protein [Burkholderiales bacterium RIFCSPLOWO2_12_FULL_61_40]
MLQTPADKIIDGRGLEPPEPFVLTMDALGVMEPSQKLLLILTREPFPLYRALQNQGYSYQTEVTMQGTFEILIWRKQF